MTDLAPGKSSQLPAEGWPVFELWKKYEDITMHFNDLLMRLRTQALAAVAALATLIGIFARADAGADVRWQMLTFAFLTLLIFWIAIWILDFRYYNRLLIGAVVALVELEAHSKDNLHVRHINMSTRIEDAVAGHLPKNPRASLLSAGRWYFYFLVGSVLFFLFAYSFLHWIKT